MKLEQALAIVETVVGEAAGPVSVFVADGARRARRGRDDGRSGSRHAPERAAEGLHGRAQRRAFDARPGREGPAKPAELASFDPFFTFFQGGVAAFDGERRVGAVGVSGLAGADDDALARRALAQAGLGDGPR